MIKCSGYGKLLKQSFFIGLISFFTLLVNSSVKAEWNFYDVNENFSVLGATEFTNKVLSSSAGVLDGVGMEVKPLILTQSYMSGLPSGMGNKLRYRVIYYRDTNNELNFILNKKFTTNSGYYNVSHYHVENFYRFAGTGFDSYVLDSSLATNGEQVSTTSFYENSQLKGAMTRYAYLYRTSSQSLQSAICFVYDNLGFSICALGTSAYGNSTQTAIPSGASIDPADFDKSIIGTSPRTSNSSQGGTITGPTTGNNSILTGDYTYGTCTYDQIIEYAESQGMTRNLCYGGLDNRDNLSLTGIYNPVPGTGKMLDDIYGHTSESGQGANDWFMYRRQVYQNPYVYSTSVWTSKPAVLKTYFDFYSTYNGYAFDFNTVYEYCLLVKFSSWGNGNNIYKGQYFKKTCEFIDNGGRDNYGSGLDGKVPNGTNWDGVGNLSGTTNYNNGVNFIQDIFNRLKANFPTKYDIGLGFLPAYIIVFLCAIILFRFISH